MVGRVSAVVVIATSPNFRKNQTRTGSDFWELEHDFIFLNNCTQNWVPNFI